MERRFSAADAAGCGTIRCGTSESHEKGPLGNPILYALPFAEMHIIYTKKNVHWVPFGCGTHSGFLSHSHLLKWIWFVIILVLLFSLVGVKGNLSLLEICFIFFVGVKGNLSLLDIFLFPCCYSKWKVHLLELRQNLQTWMHMVHRKVGSHIASAVVREWGRR